MLVYAKDVSIYPNVHKTTHQKVITRHLWQDYIDKCEDVMHTTGIKEVYDKRKETI